MQKNEKLKISHNDVLIPDECGIHAYNYGQET